MATAAILLIALAVYCGLLLLAETHKLRMMRALTADTNAAFARTIASIEAGTARLAERNAQRDTEREERWAAQDRRWQAIDRSFGAEWDLDYDATRRIASGWAH